MTENSQVLTKSSDLSELDHGRDPAQVWIRGLLSIAWADGEYSNQERELIEGLIQEEWPEMADQDWDPIAPEELARQLDPAQAEDFLRTAVMTAVADGLYSDSEDKLMRAFCRALGLEVAELDLLTATLTQIPDQGGRSQASPLELQRQQAEQAMYATDPLKPLRHWMDSIEIHNPKVAHFLCRLIPPQCPFERDVTVFGRKVMHIPPMCKLNPLYDQVVNLRFRALCYLADDCREDVTKYVQ
ncbi:MAG: Mo-dependent nitrogenase C-terminal domain-containing protein [Cyanophyceae cyanobacterium]